MNEQLTRSTRLHHASAAAPPEVRTTRLERALSWSDFRAVVSFDSADLLLLAVPAINAKRAERPWLGEPLGPHTRIGTADAYRREFEHGTVYWCERTGAHEVHGTIAERWREAGGESSWLGFPTTDEQALAGARPGDDPRPGGFAHFEGGSIYRTPRHGAVIVRGMVRDIWALLGWERSPLGVPVADVVFDRETGLLSGCFEHGSIAWSPAGGPVVTVTAPEASDAPDSLSEFEVETLDRLQADFAPQL